MKTLKFLGISGSLRQKSTNTGLLRAASHALPANVELAQANLLDIPLFNPDVSEKPAGVLRVFEQLRQADALVLACPEYNYSVAPALKNILDWASREPNNELLAGKPVAILGAGGGMGTSRAQYHLRQICVYLDLHPLNKPEVFANAFAGGFDADGNLTDPTLLKLVSDQMQALIKWTEKLSG